MNKDTFGRFELPDEVRAFAEQSVDQARKAFDSFTSAANQAASSLQGSALSAQDSAREITQRAMRLAEQNVASSFDFAQKLLQAKDAMDVMKLHADYVRRQIDVLSEQARDLGELASRAAAKATKGTASP